MGPRERMKQKNFLKQVRFEEGMVIPQDGPSEEDMNDAYSKLRKYSKSEIKSVVQVLEELFATYPIWTRAMLVEQLTRWVGGGGGGGGGGTYLLVCLARDCIVVWEE
jgi:hypothetical protein